MTQLNLNLYLTGENTPSPPPPKKKNLVSHLAKIDVEKFQPSFPQFRFELAHKFLESSRFFILSLPFSSFLPNRNTVEPAGHTDEVQCTFHSNLYMYIP